MSCNKLKGEKAMLRGNTPLDEQETTINMYPKQVQNFAEIYTNIATTAKQLRKLAISNPESVKIEKDNENGMFIQVPLSWICIRKPRTVRMTDEQKAAIAARLATAREQATAKGDVE